MANGDLAMENLQGILISSDVTMRQAMAAIDRGGIGIVLVLDSDGRMEATITDGDVRRAILDGMGPDTPVAELQACRPGAHRQPTVAWSSTPRAELLQMMQSRSIRQIPLVDDERRVVDVVLMSDLIGNRVQPMSAVVMAGGYGSRLRPLTEETPKPMLEVDGRPLMERVIDQLQAAGIRRVTVTTHYKPEVISEHFGNGNGNGVEISYIHEEEPLGTAGALGLMEIPDEAVLVMNGDVLTELNLQAMIDFHRDHKADMTVAVRKYELRVPYGVVKTRGFRVTELSEKPVQDFFISAGMYLLEPAAFGYIPASERFDMTDLIEQMVAAKCRVVSFPVVEYWLDISQPGDYELAQKHAADGRSESWIGTASACW